MRALVSILLSLLLVATLAHGTGRVAGGGGAVLDTINKGTDTTISQSEIDSYDAFVFAAAAPLSDQDITLPAPSSGLARRVTIYNDSTFTTDAQWRFRSFTVNGLGVNLHPGYQMTLVYLGSAWRLLNATLYPENYLYEGGCWTYSANVTDCTVNTTIDASSDTWIRFPQSNEVNDNTLPLTESRRRARPLLEQKDDGSGNTLSVWCADFDADSLDFYVQIQTFVKFATAETTEIGRMYWCSFAESGEDFTDGIVDENSCTYTGGGLDTFPNNSIKGNASTYTDYTDADSSGSLQITIDNGDCLAALGYLVSGTSIAIEAEEFRVSFTPVEK